MRSFSRAAAKMCSDWGLSKSSIILARQRLRSTGGEKTLMIEANASHRSRSVVSFGASRWCHDFALPSDLHRLTIRRSIPVLLPVTPFCIRFNDDQSNAFRSYSAIGGTRTPTRSVCGFEHEYHFIEYEYDFSGTEVAISEKCRKTSPRSSFSDSANRPSTHTEQSTTK